METIIPISPDLLKPLLREPDKAQNVVIDLANSRPDGKTCVIYLTNLQIPFSFKANCPKERKFEAFREFIVSKYITKSIQLTETLIRLLSRVHGEDLGEGPDFLTADEIDEFTVANKELVDNIVEYYGAMPYTFMSMVDQYKQLIIDPMIAEGKLEHKKDDHIGVNVVQLAGLPDFIEEYLTWHKTELPQVFFKHSMKSGVHVHKLISERPENPTIALVYAMANGMFNDEPIQEA